MINIEKIREDFPILSTIINKRPIVYFDNAATTQKPKPVIDTMVEYYSKYNGNVHRSVHYLSDKASEAYENARIQIKNFINASSTEEIIFTSGTTEAINLLAYCFGESIFKENDEIILSNLEHHSNIVPWQIISKKKNCKIKVIPIDEKGNLLLEEIPRLITNKTKLISITHISNAIGTIVPIKRVIEIAHSNNIPVIIDGAQGIAHERVDVQDLNCDFYVFSGHKIYGPLGIGVLYAKKRWLELFPPYKGGGDMIKNVTFEHTEYNDLPFKFEAGTPNFIGAIGLASSIKYLSDKFSDIINYEKDLAKYTHKKLKELDFIKLIGEPKDFSTIFSFIVEKIHSYDVATLLDKYDIAVRSGHHCAQPCLRTFGVDGTVRISLSFYNTFEEIDYFCNVIKKIKEIF